MTSDAKKNEERDVLGELGLGEAIMLTKEQEEIFADGDEKRFMEMLQRYSPTMA